MEDGQTEAWSLSKSSSSPLNDLRAPLWPMEVRMLNSPVVVDPEPKDKADNNLSHQSDYDYFVNTNK